MPQRAHRVLIPLAALLATLPILLHGPSCGHDFDFHLLSWLEASTQFAHFGFPHWAYTPAWNAGEPRFIFYPPLSWTLGGLLGLIVPWQFVPAVFTWIALTLSGFTAHSLARCYAGPTAALLAATLYLANPYMLFTAYERTAYGELLAAAWLPLLFAAALAPHIRVLRIAVPIAFLWLTNAPAAVMGCYALAILTAVRLTQDLRHPERNTRHSDRSEEAPHLSSSPSRLRLTLTTTAGVLLGLLLAAFYILPAAYERRYVQASMAVLPGMRPQEHFLFHRMLPATPDNLFHDAVVRTASLIALTLLAAITLAFVFAFFRTRKKPVILSEARSAQSKNPEEAHARSTVRAFLTSDSPLLALTLLIAFFLTPPSLFLWNIVPQLHFLQFPWRLCALLATILCIAIARAISTSWSSTPNFLSSRSAAERSAVAAGSVIALAAILILPAWHLFHQPCDDEDNVAARVALFHSNRGTEPTDEYTPTDADPDALHPNNPPYWLIPECGHETHRENAYIACSLPGDLNQGPPPNAAPGQSPQHLSLTVPSAQYLVLNRRAYPAWHITVDDKHLLLPSQQPSGVPDILVPLIPDPLPQRLDGLIAIPLEPGTHTIDLHFDETPDRLTGLAISTTTLILTLLITFRRRNRPSPMHTP